MDVDNVWTGYRRPLHLTMIYWFPIFSITCNLCGGFHAEMIVTRQVQENCKDWRFICSLFCSGASCHKCIYGYLLGLCFPQGIHLARMPSHTFILYMCAVTREAMKKVKWKRFIFLPLSSGSDGKEKIWSVNLQIRPPTVLFENMSPKLKQGLTNIYFCLTDSKTLPPAFIILETLECLQIHSACFT